MRLEWFRSVGSPCRFWPAGESYQFWFVRSGGFSVGGGGGGGEV